MHIFYGHLFSIFLETKEEGHADLFLLNLKASYLKHSGKPSSRATITLPSTYVKFHGIRQAKRLLSSRVPKQKFLCCEFSILRQSQKF